MAFRPPNYRQQRGDRDRAKQRKKQERLQRRADDAQKRREERDALLGPASGPDAPPQTAHETTTPEAPSENE
jgi:hypothetical protein